jgi:ABC-type uncharacterized transport system substrate-binding protein
MGCFEQPVKTAAKTRGIEVRIAHAKKSDEIPSALRQLADDKVQAAIVPTNGLLNSSRKLIVETAMALHLPLVFGTREPSATSALMFVSSAVPEEALMRLRVLSFC